MPSKKWTRRKKEKICREEQRSRSSEDHQIETPSKKRRIDGETGNDSNDMSCTSENAMDVTGSEEGSPIGEEDSPFFTSSTPHFSTPKSRGGRPSKESKKKSRGRPRSSVSSITDIFRDTTIQTPTTSRISHSSYDQVCTSQTTNKFSRKRCRIAPPSGLEFNEHGREIDFSTLLVLDFASETNIAARIWQTAGMRLYVSASPIIVNSSNATNDVRLIEILWNDLDQWLNHEFIHAFLCFISLQCPRKTVVVDSLITSPVGRFPATTNSFNLNACFNYTRDIPTEIILIPLHFPSHWALVIHDIEFGTIFVDSLQKNGPNRFETNHEHYHKDRDLLIKNAISKIVGYLLMDDIVIHTMEPSNYTTQNDLCSCGYFVCLYAESWIMTDKILILDPLNITAEKKRILWHLNELYGTDSVKYHPRQKTTINNLSQHINIDCIDTNESRIDLAKENFLLWQLPAWVRIHDLQEIFPLLSYDHNSIIAHNISDACTLQPKEIQSVINAHSNRSAAGLKHLDAYSLNAYICWLSELFSRVVSDDKKCNISIVKSTFFLNRQIQERAHLDKRNEYDFSYGHVYGNVLASEFIVLIYGRIMAENVNFNRDNGHFAVGIFDVRSKTLFYFDSLEMFDITFVREEMQHALDTILDPGQNINDGMFPIVDFCYCRLRDQLCNRQPDGYSCGFFACLHTELFFWTGRFALSNMHIANFCVQKYTAKVLNVVQKISQNIFVPYYGFNVEHFKAGDEYKTQEMYVIESKPYPISMQIPASQIVMPPPPPPPHVLPMLKTTKVIDQSTSGNDFSTVNMPVRQSPRNKSKRNSTSDDENFSNPVKKPEKKHLSKQYTTHCHVSKYHKGFGCAAITINHLPDYMDLRLETCSEDYRERDKSGMVRCIYCGKWLFPTQTKWPGWSKCCSRGKIDLSVIFDELQQIHPLIAELLFFKDKSFKKTEHDQMYRRSKNYFENIKFYNNEFALGSMTVNEREDVGWGIQKINGLIKYNIGGPIAPDGRLLRHGQVYTLDPKDALECRLERNAQIGNRLMPDLLGKLHAMLRDINPLVHLYETAGNMLRQRDEFDTNADIRIQILNVRSAQRKGVDLEKSIDPRRVEKPSGEVIGSVWIDDGEGEPPSGDLIVYGHKGVLTEVKYWNPNFYAIQFPMILTFAQQLFRLGIPLKIQLDEEPTIDDSTQLFDQIITGDDKDDTGIDIEHLPDQAKPKGKRRFVSHRQFFRYIFANRGSTPTSDHWLWSRGGQLCQTFILAVCNQIDRSEHDFIRRYVQKDLRMALPDAFIKFLQNMISRPESNLPPGTTLGKVYIGPAYIKGTRRFYQASYADFCTISRAFGNWDLFITITANPNWPEIKGLLSEDKDWMNRPDVITEVFEERIKHQFLHLVEEKKIFGATAAYVGVYEHQNRGMVHFHFLLTLQKTTNNVFKLPDWEPVKLSRTEYCAQYIQSEIPSLPDIHDPEYEKKLRYRNLVIDHYIHVCSSDKCLDNPKHKCRFRFPRPFSHTNIVQDNAYPLYQRRPPAPNQACKNAFPHLYGETCEKFLRNVKTTYDNSRVVPHNRFLSMAFDCHCNVELVSGDKCCQYTLEYVTKGFGMAFVLADVVNNETNPVANYDQFHEIQLVHFMTAQEAFRRIMSFPITLKSHSVKVLKIHLPNQIPVPFDNENVESVAVSLTQQKEFMNQKSMLTAYVELASVDAFAAKLKYTEINRYYKFDKTNTKWIQRKDKEELALVRMWSCNGRNIELYALRALLLHCPGRKIVEYWTKNLDQGIPFLEMAQQEGLVENDTIWENAMDAITGEKVSRMKIIDFFALLLISGQPKNPLSLIKKYEQSLFLPGNSSKEHKLQEVLAKLEKRLRRHGIMIDESGATACEQFGLGKAVLFKEQTEEEYVNNYFFPSYIGDCDEDEDASDGRSKLGWDMYFNERISTLNAKQKQFFDAISELILDTKIDHKRYHFLYGEGGTEKSYLLEVIIAFCRANKIRVLCTASTGIAALNLFDGITVHYGFYVPLDVNSKTVPRISRSTHTASILRATDVIIIDEISSLHGDVFGYVDRTLRFLYEGTDKCNLPFAGKLVLLAGDWKQILPVVKGGSMYDAFLVSVKNHPLFKHFTVHKLTENMRLEPDQIEYRKFCLAIGTGANFDSSHSLEMKVPDSLLVDSESELIDFVYKHPESGYAPFQTPLSYGDFLGERAILSPHNDVCDYYNKEIMRKLSGTENVLTSTNIIHRSENADDDYDDVNAVNGANSLLETIESRTPSKFPPHKITIVMGAIAMLIRNISTWARMCNGTRLQVIEVFSDLLKCRHLFGLVKGTEVYVPKYRFQYGRNQGEHGTPFDRIQFPIRIAFAMTDNKGQGQTIMRLGLALRETQAFAHGHNYVAFSRVTSGNNIRVLTRHEPKRGKIENVVCEKILDSDELPANSKGKLQYNIQ